MSEILGPAIDLDNIPLGAVTASGGTAPAAVVVTSVLGGLGRVVFGSNGRPAHVGRLAAVIDVDSVPSDALSGEESPVLGPVDDPDSVPVGAVTGSGGTT